jgi:hypothetical protein
MGGTPVSVVKIEPQVVPADLGEGAVYAVRLYSTDSSGSVTLTSSYPLRSREYEDAVHEAGEVADRVRSIMGVTS